MLPCLSCGPYEAACIEPCCGVPHSKAIVHQCLDTRGPCIGEHVAVMSMDTAKRVYHVGEQTLGAQAHVHQHCTQPEGIACVHGTLSTMNGRDATHAPMRPHGTPRSPDEVIDFTQLTWRQLGLQPCLGIARPDTCQHGYVLLCSSRATYVAAVGT